MVFLLNIRACSKGNAARSQVEKVFPNIATQEVSDSLLWVYKALVNYLLTINKALVTTYKAFVKGTLLKSQPIKEILKNYIMLWKIISNISLYKNIYKTI